MEYKQMRLENGKFVVAKQVTINNDHLTSECWLIQFQGLAACKNCEFKNTKNCGGKNIRKTLKNANGHKVSKTEGIR